MNPISPPVPVPRPVSFLRLLLLSWLAADTLVLAGSQTSFLSLDFVREIPMAGYLCLWAAALLALLGAWVRLPRQRHLLCSPLPYLALYLAVLLIKGTAAL